MRRIVFFLMGFLLANCAWAQPVNPERMNREIEIVENILSSLVQEQFQETYGTRTIWAGRGDVEGSYLEDFGILYTINSNFLPGAYNFKFFGEKAQWNPVIVVPNEFETSDKKKKDKSAATDTIRLNFEEAFETLTETFAADYAYLLRELPPDEKIMLRFGDNKTNFAVWHGTRQGLQKMGRPTLSAVIQNIDVRNHQSGKISRSQLASKIKYSSVEDQSGEPNRDVVLLTSVFSRLYQKDLSEVFSLIGDPSYESIEGLGTVIYLRMGSEIWRGSHPAILLRERLRNQRGEVIIEEVKGIENEEEIAEKIDADYPKFREEFKRNVIEYGSIVKNLNKDEALIFRVKFRRCESCKVLPEDLEVTVKQTVLEAYRKNEIDLEKALRSVKVSDE